MNNKWIPYFKRENSIYKKQPFWAWAITIVVIIGGVWLMFKSYEESARNVAYNTGYRDALKQYYKKIIIQKVKRGHSQIMSSIFYIIILKYKYV